MIVIISGSPRGVESISTKAAIDIAKASNQDYKLYSAADWNIEYCTGCMHCFSHGHCFKERQDDLGMIIDDLIAADGVIMASPVYTGAISGQLKTLIDRMASCSHVLLLLNKPAITIAVANRSHIEQANAYMSEILQYFGAAVICQVDIKGEEPSISAEEAGQQLEHAIKQTEPLELSLLTKVWHYRQLKAFTATKFFSEIMPSKFGECKWFFELH